MMTDYTMDVVADKDDDNENVDATGVEGNNQPSVSDSTEPNIEDGSSFIEALARYYSDFLSTDFKKGRLPKRRFQTRDRNGRRSGITLDTFPTFVPALQKVLSNEFQAIPKIEIRRNKYQANLPPIVLRAIEAEIDKIDFFKLDAKNTESIGRFKKDILEKEADFELESQNLIHRLKQNVGVEIGAALIERLQPVFEGSASNLVDALVAVDDDVSELIVTPLEDSLPSVIHPIVVDGDEGPLLDIITEQFHPDKIQNTLKEYFSTLSASDLSTELRELSNLEQLDDNLEFYLYIGEARHNNHEFPIFYVPFAVEFEGSITRLTLEPRLLVNKMAVDYIASVVQEGVSTRQATPVESRIVYLDPVDRLFDVADNILEPILRAFHLEGDLSFNGSRGNVRSPSVVVTNSLKFALFDKSDESMLTDYEELLQKLSDGSGSLFNFISEFVDSFLTENPNVITNEVYDEWDDTNIPERLVFDTPIPLVEEQRKIVSALNNKEGKFITVEGPPGTGKSHTISAIAFGAILRGQSILVLSDKKEALDVVQNKLDDTLTRVRPSDDFVNPILRLGRVGTNFRKIVSNSSIEKLRIQSREIRKNEDDRKGAYEKVVKSLKAGISEKISGAEKILVSEIFLHEAEENDFRNEWEGLDKFSELFDATDFEYLEELGTIHSILKLRSKCRSADKRLAQFAQHFGDDARGLARAVEFILLVQRAEKKESVFQAAPYMSFPKISSLKKKCAEIRGCQGFFGYLFAGAKLKEIKESIEILGSVPIKGIHKTPII